MTRWPLGALTLVLVAGCSDPQKPVPPDDTSGGSGAAGTGASAAGAGAMQPAGGTGAGASAGTGGAGEPALACNDLELDAPPFELSYDADPAPEATGGEIADGTYFVTSQIMYETASGPTLELGRVKVVIEGDVWQELDGDAEADGVNPNRAFTSALAVSDTFVTLTRTCPRDGLPDTADFSADADGFTLYVDDRGTTFGSVFTRQ